MKCIRRPEIVDAIRWTDGNLAECIDFLGESAAGTSGKGHCEAIMVATPQGLMDAHPGDWLVKKLDGSCCPVGRYDFERLYQTYEGE